MGEWKMVGCIWGGGGGVWGWSAAVDTAAAPALHACPCSLMITKAGTGTSAAIIPVTACLPSLAHLLTPIQPLFLLLHLPCMPALAHLSPTPPFDHHCCCCTCPTCMPSLISPFHSIAIAVTVVAVAFVAVVVAAAACSCVSALCSPSLLSVVTSAVKA